MHINLINLLIIQVENITSLYFRSFSLQRNFKIHKTLRLTISLFSYFVGLVVFLFFFLLSSLIRCLPAISNENHTLLCFALGKPFV